MNRTTFPILAVALLFGGCATSPTTTGKRASVESKKPEQALVPLAAKPEQTLLSKVAAIPEPAKVEEATPASKRVAEDFVNSWDGAVPHSVSDTTGFPEALLSLQPGRPKPKYTVPKGYAGIPTRGLTADGQNAELYQKDWSGIILTPVLAQVAKAYATGVKLVNVEVHPLTDGRVRVWTRLLNLRQTTMPAEIACSFKTPGPSAGAPPWFYYLEIPAGETRDVFFISAGGETANYTVLVRDTQMRQKQASRR